MLDLEIVTLRIMPAVADSVREHARREERKGRYEAVGFIAGKPGRSVGTHTVRLNNHSPEPQHGFFVEPWEQYRAEKRLEEEGLEILAIYHSHVNSEALPSQTDHARAWPNGFVIIYSVVFDDLRAYRKENEWLEPVELIVKKGGL